MRGSFKPAHELAIPELPSYNHLLSSDHVVDPMDAIIVPTGRPASSIETAATLGRLTSTPVVALCSKQASAGEVAEVLADKAGSTWCAIDVPEGYSHPLFDFTATAKIPDFANHRGESDLSVKRNLGLIIGRTLGDRILFLDDDIQVQPSDLRRASSLLSSHKMAGFQSTDFPDNSVVVHAQRLIRLMQPQGGRPNHPGETFASASCLAIMPWLVESHFPDIYNEDWLFMIDDIDKRQVAYAGAAQQDQYDPFASPKRAAAEEFGEIIAEGTFGIIGTGNKARLSMASYWNSVLEARRKTITLLRNYAPSSMPEVAASLHAAQQIADVVTPMMCIEYVQAWREDQAVWQERLRDLPTFETVEKALYHVDLTSYSAASAPPLLSDSRRTTQRLRLA